MIIVWGLQGVLWALVGSLSSLGAPPAGALWEPAGGTSIIKSGRLTGNLLTRLSEPQEALQLKAVWGI